MYSWNCCRTCLSTQNLNPIFIISSQSDKYTKVIRTVTGAKVEFSDTMPHEMCLHCINFINESIKFRRICEEVQIILQEKKCNSIKLESFKLKSEKILNCIDITDYYDDDFKDFDDNITLDTLQFHEATNEDKVDSIKNTIENIDGLKAIENNVENHFNCNNRVDPSHDILENIVENYCSSNNIGDPAQVDCDSKIILNTIRDHVDSNKVTVDNNVDSKPTVLLEKRVVFNKKRKSRVKTVRKKEIAEHVKVKEEIECEFCHKILTSKLSLRNHYKIHTGFDIVCEHCGKKFITRRLLLMHCRAKHGYEKTDKCSFCDYRASNAEQVKIHERLHTGEKPFVCKTCNAGFHRKSSYLQHIAIHLPEKTVQCDQCPARFKSVTLMRIHKNRHRPSPYTFKCGVCNNSFARRRNVARHLQRVHGLAPDHHIHRIKIH